MDVRHTEAVQRGREAGVAPLRVVVERRVRVHARVLDGYDTTHVNRSELLDPVRRVGRSPLDMIRRGDVRAIYPKLSLKPQESSA